MTDQSTSALSPDDLAANQAGRLSDAQRRRLSAFARSDHKNELVGTLVLGGLAVLLFTEHGPATNTLLRLAVASASAVGAVLFLVRALTGTDALSRDLTDTHVQRVEGAVERQEYRGTGRGSTPPSYYLAVGGKRYHAFRDAYDAAPEAGYVALYLLPHSGRVVNLERLPGPELPAGALDHPSDLVRELVPQMRSHDQVERAEARAEIEQVAEVAKARVEESHVKDATPPPADQRDPRPLTESLPGAWAGSAGGVVFMANGTAVMTQFGRDIRGQWSVDGQGRLHVGMGGRDEPVDAWIVGDTLTITQDGEGFSYQRAAS